MAARGSRASSLGYFQPLIAELLEQPLPAGYSAYLRRKNEEFARMWSVSVKSKKQPVGSAPSQQVLMQKGNQQRPKRETR